MNKEIFNDIGDTILIQNDKVNESIRTVQKKALDTSKGMYGSIWFSFFEDYYNDARSFDSKAVVDKNRYDKFYKYLPFADIPKYDDRKEAFALAFTYPYMEIVMSQLVNFYGEDYCILWEDEKPYQIFSMSHLKEYLSPDVIDCGITYGQFLIPFSDKNSPHPEETNPLFYKPSQTIEALPWKMIDISIPFENMKKNYNAIKMKKREFYKHSDYNNF